MQATVGQISGYVAITWVVVFTRSCGILQVNEKPLREITNRLKIIITLGFLFRSKYEGDSV